MSYFSNGENDARRGWHEHRNCYDPPGSPGSPETIEYDYGYFQEIGYWHGTQNRYEAGKLGLGSRTTEYYDKGYRRGHRG